MHRKSKFYPPITGLPILNAPSVRIIGKNKNRIGIIINNYGIQTVYLYGTPEIVRNDNGFSIFPGFGLAMTQEGTCPQSEIYAGQAAAGGILNIIEIVSVASLDV